MDTAFLLSELNQKNRGEGIFRSNQTQDEIVGWWKENSEMSHLESQRKAVFHFGLCNFQKTLSLFFFECVLMPRSTFK